MKSHKGSVPALLLAAAVIASMGCGRGPGRSGRATDVEQTVHAIQSDRSIPAAQKAELIRRARAGELKQPAAAPR